jgi:hypothetical protein
LTDAGPDARSGDADTGIVDASFDDASEAGTDADAWIDMSSNPAGCLDEPNVPCGWGPTNFTPAGSISLTAPWDYAQMAGANGASAWVGDTHALVIDAAGNVFKGPLTGGAVQ